jgi:signal transduction histidine kinase
MSENEAQSSAPNRGLLARIALSAIAVAVGLALVFTFLFIAIVSLRQRSAEARHSTEVISAANRVQGLVVDLETGVRGFFITRDEQYLAPWKQARADYPHAMETLVSLTGSKGVQRERVQSIRAAIDTYLTGSASPLIVDFIRRNPSTGPTVVTAGRRQVEGIRNRFATFLQTEQRLSDARNAQARATARHALVVGALGLAAAFTLILIGAMYLSRAVARPVRATAEAASRIAGGDFSSRLRTDGPGEVGELERAFNTMAASLERTLADLEERNQTLVESERVKSELVSNVSHELRTPLASVLGFSTLMLERDLVPEERRRYLEVIRTEARRLATLLNDLLDLQRVEQEALELRREVFDLNDLLATQLTLYSAQSGDHELRLDGAHDPVMVLGDRDRLAQVIGNLLSNAIKYSPEGGAVVVGTVTDGDEVTLWVRDTGLGIPEEHQEQIFTKFFRGDVGRQRGIPGTGLGLVLAKQIVEAHGGDVGFESEEGSGSVFWFCVPAAETPTDSDAESLAARDDADVRHRM